MDPNVKELERLEGWAATLVASLAPQEVRKLFRRMGLYLRRQNAKRITKQVDPNGRRWARRKSRDGQGKVAQKRKMLLGFRKARHLKVKASTGGVTVGYEGRAARIGAVHHFGLKERLTGSDGAKGALVKFAERRLLGLAVSDREGLEELTVEHFDKEGTAA